MVCQGVRIFAVLLLSQFVMEVASQFRPSQQFRQPQSPLRQGRIISNSNTNTNTFSPRPSTNTFTNTNTNTFSNSNTRPSTSTNTFSTPVSSGSSVSSPTVTKGRVITIPLP